MKKITYTYKKNTGYYTPHYDRARDYILRHLEGVAVVLEIGDWVQIETQTPEAEEAMTAFCSSDMGMLIYSNATIKNIMDMLEDQARLNE